MKKAEIERRLKTGETLESFLSFGHGQDCDIFKADDFLPGDELLYIPDLYLNEIPVDKDLSKDPDTLEEVLGCCYTGDDFIEECEGNVEMAKRLFWFCDWQHPSSAYAEWENEDE